MGKQKDVVEKKGGINEKDMEELAERNKEMMLGRKTRRVRSETQV